MSTANKKFYESANFWTAVVLAFGGLVVGFPEGQAAETVSYLFATIAGAMGIRERLKNATIDWKSWLTSTNTWNYIGAAAVAIVPNIPMDLFTRLRDLADAAIGGNWQGILTAMFSIGTIIYYLVKPKTPAVA